MSTLYTCHGKDCPLKEQGRFPIIDPKAIRYEVLFSLKAGANDRTKTGFDICEVCFERIYGMLEP